MYLPLMQIEAITECQIKISRDCCHAFLRTSAWLQVSGITHYGEKDHHTLREETLPSC